MTASPYAALWCPELLSPSVRPPSLHQPASRIAGVTHCAVMASDPTLTNSMLNCPQTAQASGCMMLQARRPAAAGAGADAAARRSTATTCWMDGVLGSESASSVVRKWLHVSSTRMEAAERKAASLSGAGLGGRDRGCCNVVCCPCTRARSSAASVLLAALGAAGAAAVKSCALGGGTRGHPTCVGNASRDRTRRT